MTISLARLLTMKFSTAALSAFLLAESAYSWGAIGHETVG